jgi:23S rRNA (guanosine2251-2'-O)-methyltransferase
MARGRSHGGARAPRHHIDGPLPALEGEEDLLAALRAAPAAPLLLVLEGVQDPRNLGSCFRTASGAGATALLAPRKASCGITDTVREVSCGGVAEVPFLQVGNLGQILRRLQDEGLRLVGTADRADRSLFETDLRGPTALVLGSEGWGLRRKTAELCDETVSLPMAGRVDCLNVSVSAGIALYEAVRQRGFGPPGRTGGG